MSTIIRCKYGIYPFLYAQIIPFFPYTYYVDKMWLPYFIQVYDNVFLLMFELVRPNFWIWIWLQNQEAELLEENVFSATVGLCNAQKVELQI